MSTPATPAQQGAVLCSGYSEGHIPLIELRERCIRGTKCPGIGASFRERERQRSGWKGFALTYSCMMLKSQGGI